MEKESKEIIWLIVLNIVLNIIYIGAIVMFVFGIVTCFGIFNIPLYGSILMVVFGAFFGAIPLIKKFFGGNIND